MNTAHESPTDRRRRRRHDATRAEIKDVARRQIAAAGAAALSLRAVARAMDLTVGALYRYYAGRDDLVTALVTDGYHGLADAIEAARDAVDPGDHAGRLRAALHAYRDWCVARPGDFALLFGTPIPGYEAPPEPTLPAAMRSTAAMVDILSAAHRAGALTLPEPYDRPPAALARQLEAWSARQDHPHDPRLLHVSLVGWSRLQGLVSLEVFGHLDLILGDASTLFASEVEALLRQFSMAPTPARSTA